jgi:hypothetical protein
MIFNRGSTLEISAVDTRLEPWEVKATLVPAKAVTPIEDIVPHKGAAAGVIDELSATEHVKTSTDALKKVGFQIGKVKDMPKDAIEALKAEEPVVTQLHAALGESFAGALDETGGTVLEGVRKNASKIKVVYAGYEPAGAEMSTVTGNGKAFFMINTKYDPAKLYNKYEKATLPLAPKITKGLSYGARKGLEAYIGGDELEQSVRLEGKLSAFHELAHMIDNATNHALSESLMDTLITSGVAKDQKSLVKWLQENISGYATASPRDAMAESVAKYLYEGSLPGPLEDWAQTMLLAPKAWANG